MSTTSGGDTMHAQDNSVNTVYNGDRTATAGQRVSPPTSSNGDSGLDNSNTESSAGDAKLIIDVPDFSKEMETPRTGIDNPSFETDKTDVPKPLANGHNGSVVTQENGRREKDKMAEAVNLELINMKPFAKGINGKENGVPAKKAETAVNMNDTYDDYFIPVNEHKKYIRGGEKLYVTKDKRDMNQSKKPFMCWMFGLVLLAAAVVVAILASTGVIFNNETAVESRNFAENEKIAGFAGNNHRVQFSSSVSPPPDVDSSSPFSPPTTDMSGIHVPRTVEGKIVIDNMQFTPNLANRSSAEFQTLASSVENELKNALFKEQTLNGASDSIRIKVIEFSSGSVVVRYRIGWEYKDDNEPQDLIDAETLKTRLDMHLREHDGFLYNYRVPVSRLRSDPVMDKCKIENGKCSHYCAYDYTQLDFVCSCPSDLIIKKNMKDCKPINDDSDEIDEFMFSNNGNDQKPNDEESFDIKSTLDSFPEHEHNVPETEPEAKSESEFEINLEPEPEVKPEPEPSSEPEVNLGSESSSESEINLEPEPSSEPAVKPEPEPSSEHETKSIPEPAVKPEPEPSSEHETKSEPEPVVKPEPEPSSEHEIKSEPEPAVKPEPEPSSEHETKPEPQNAVKPEPEPSSEPAVKPEPEPSSEPAIKPELEPNLEHEKKSEPEPSSEPVVKPEPEPNLEHEKKSEPEPSSEPSIKPESEYSPEHAVKPEPEPNSEPAVKPEPEPSLGDIYDSLSDVDISSELVSAEQNVQPPKSSSTEKSIFVIDQSDREAKSHSDEDFSHEIKPEVTYSMSTESEFESKTESVSKENSKSKENDSLLEDIKMNVGSEESTTLPTITDDWLTTTLSSVHDIPKLPGDLEVLEKENDTTEKETKTESNKPLNNERIELKYENKSTSDLVSETFNQNTSEIVTESPEKSMSDNVKDMSDVTTVSTIDTSSTGREDMSSSSNEFENISKERVTDTIYMTTMPTTVEHGSIMGQDSSINSNSSEKKQSDDLTSLEKTNIPDPTKKLQSLTSLEEHMTNIPAVVDAISTSTQSNVDDFNENSSTNERESLDQIMTHGSEQNLANTANDDEKTSALDLYQKPELKKKEKKTSKNPEFYFSDTGFTKRNKTKIEKENKKNNKSDLTDMSEMLNSNKCEEGQFQCINGTTKDGSYCINMWSRCNTNKDCTDNSDEYDCLEESCSENFQCKSGECLQRNLVCNNILDCEDGSDEQSCDLWKCADNEKQCNTGGQCLPVSNFCDGKSDCTDHSDELQCNNTCNGYQCTNGRCISNTLRCNGVNDCNGGEDEQNCECNDNEFKCNTGSECIPKTQVCDNIAQCTDRSDEWQCIQLDSTQLLVKKEGEIAMKVCNTNWSDQWSNFVCHSLGFTETKATNVRTSESTDDSVSYLKLKDDLTLSSYENLTDNLELSTTYCDTIEIKCSSKHLCGDFGGKDPLSMEMWPSVIYLQNTKTHKSCTSSLIKRNWLLSSYSCVKSIDESLSSDQWEAVSSKTRVANESNILKRSVSRIISHPGVKFEKFRYFNDTVLVELSVPYDLTDEVSTICLPEKVVDDKQPCVTAGWSYESPGVFKQFSRYLSDPLMQIDLCNSTKHFNGFLTEREICVASREMEASNMEIGSPLMCLAENGLWQLQGMLSYRGGYGRSSKPSLYNAIIDAKPWVENIIASVV